MVYRCPVNDHFFTIFPGRRCPVCDREYVPAEGEPTDMMALGFIDDCGDNWVLPAGHPAMKRFRKLVALTRDDMEPLFSDTVTIRNWLGPWTLNDEDTIDPGEIIETPPSPKEIDERLNRYFGQDGEDSLWKYYS